MPGPAGRNDAYLNRSGADLVRRKIIEQGVTVVQNQNDLLPLKNLGHTRVAFVLQNVPHLTIFSGPYSYTRRTMCIMCPLRWIRLRPIPWFGC
jgi:hypothetical protein